jgi:hypothetical protein
MAENFAGLNKSEWYVVWLGSGVVASSVFCLEKMAVVLNVRFASGFISGVCSRAMMCAGHGAMVGFLGSLGSFGLYMSMNKYFEVDDALTVDDDLTVDDALTVDDTDNCDDKGSSKGYILFSCAAIGMASLVIAASTLPPLVSFSNAQLVANAIAFAAPCFSAVMAINLSGD